MFYCSSLRGIRPIMNWILEDELFLKGALVGDKVIGKAAALLLVFAEVSGIYAEVISEPAKQVLKEHNIPYAFQTQVPYIINRTKDGICPMEQSVLKISSPREALQVLQDKLKQLQKQK